MSRDCAWLIEKHKDGKLFYWTGLADNKRGDWTPVVDLAVRFARREDAERMANWHAQTYHMPRAFPSYSVRVAEHIWIGGDD